MRTRKFRAWVRKTVNNRTSLPIDMAHAEFEPLEEQARKDGKFDEWYNGRSNRIDELISKFDEIFPNMPNTTTIYEMLYSGVSISADGKIIKPYNCEVLKIMDYVECLDAYEGDWLIGKETDEYGTLMSSWRGLIKYNEECGRIMIFDVDVDDWYEIDDFNFDYVQSISGLNTEED